MEQGEKYFVAKITSDLLDSESGRVKKVKEEKLVLGYTPTDIEAKITKVYENYTMDWRITSITESKIDEVIE
jgi:N-acetylmuramic acid 6-phosphate (MurNAc-6-P) etherase